MPARRNAQEQVPSSVGEGQRSTDDDQEPFEVFPAPTSWKDRAASFSAFEITILVLLPWAIFTLVMCLFVFAHKEHAELVWALVALCLLLAFLFVASGAGKQRSSVLALGLLSLGAVTVAVMVGLYVKDDYLEELWRIEGGATYGDVSVLSQAKDHGDATILNFASETYVDTDRTLGYMEDGDVYCVAPLQETSTRPQTELSAVPQYWASGKNCCHKRSDFKCGAVKEANSDARSGLVLSGNDPDHEKFHSAIRMAQAVYDMDLADPGQRGVLLLRVINDPQEEKDEMWLSALTIVALVSTTYLIASAVAAVLIRTCLSRKASPQQNFPWKSNENA
mmetsp:Transcript_21385/g.40964  ORF Transcript_21385/g.40964 Transcript_21385/m.40964 type:complete len:336 (+) Transcript_21385:117-1124(+)